MASGDEMPQPEEQKLVREVKVLNCATEATLMVLKIKQGFHLRPGTRQISLLRSRIFGMSRNAPPPLGGALCDIPKTQLRRRQKAN